MAKIRIEQAPTFSLTVEIPRVGQKPEKVPFTFKFLDRERLAEIGDEDMAHAKSIKELIERGEASASHVTATTIDRQCETLLEVLEGWGFEDEFNEENVRALVRSYAAAPEAILAAYREAYHKVREGN